jgi:hypothetical protein
MEKGNHVYPDGTLPQKYTDYRVVKDYSSFLKALSSYYLTLPLAQSPVLGNYWNCGQISACSAVIYLVR